MKNKVMMLINFEMLEWSS